MSYERQQGKDQIIFLTEEDYNEPSKLTLDYDKEDEEQMGLIRPDGEINWNCPCLQGMADGPCGQEFRNSFSCFHYSEADPKGSDCIPQFKEMQECFLRYPEVYDGESADEKDSKDEGNEETKNNIDNTAQDSGQNDNVLESPEHTTNNNDAANNNINVVDEQASKIQDDKLAS